jgi:hypothetical protein
MVVAAVGAVLAIPVLGARIGGPATTVTNVIPFSNVIGTSSVSMYCTTPPGFLKLKYA